MAPSNPNRIAVLGGGICGLSAAFRLTRALPGREIHVFDASPICGGVIGTLRRGDLLLETGPLAFPVRAPVTAELLGAAGHANLGEPAHPPGPPGLWNGDRIVPLARAPLGILRSRLLSVRCLIRLAAEPFIPPSRSEDESVRDFFRRRTGIGFLDAVMEPLCSAIQAGDPASLGMEANFPALRAWERAPGRMAWGLCRQEWNRRRRSAPPLILAGGPEGNGPIIQALVEALRKTGVRFRLGHPVEKVEPAGGDGILIRAGGTAESFDACISCLRPADLLGAYPSAPAEVREFLDGVPFASVSLAYLVADAASPPNGFPGAHCLFTASSGVGALSLSLPSRMQPGRCAPGRELVRVSMGGMRDPGAAGRPDSDLRSLAMDAAARVLGANRVSGEFHLIRQNGSLPQLGVGHPRRLARARERLAREAPRFILSGSGTVGAGIEKAAAEGKRAASELAERIGRPHCPPA